MQYGWTALSFASELGQTSTARILLHYGAAVDCMNYVRITADVYHVHACLLMLVSLCRRGEFLSGMQLVEVTMRL